MKILVIGGYGNFGKRLVLSLVEHYDYEVAIAGRSLTKAKMFQQQLINDFGKTVECFAVDVLKDDLAQLLTQVSPSIVVNASGPFHAQRDDDQAYKVANACIEIGCHYVDLADDRAFVANISQLNDKAQSQGVMVVSGASTVPGLTAAVIDEYIDEFVSLETIRFGISPGNKTERGKATVASILSYTGKPFSTLCNGQQKTIYGWQDINRYDFGRPLGKRWMSNCDIPDLALLPVRYPMIKNVSFQAGLEVTLMHLGLWGLSWLSRAGLVNNWSLYTDWLFVMSEWFLRWGSDAGGMFVVLKGVSEEDKNKTLVWQLIAEDGFGPNVPTISAEIIINKMAKGGVVTGAMPCMGLFTLKEFFVIAARWGIEQRRLS